MSNSTSDPALDTAGGNQQGLDLSTPVTVLPLVAALAVVLFTLVGGCIAYHRRQRKRTQDLVRQLRVTERRIDAIGIITSKKQQALATGKADYCPPAAAPCSRTLEISNGCRQQPSTDKEQGQSFSSLPANIHHGEKTFTVSVQINENSITDNSEDTKLDMVTNASYYCSTCKLEESVSETALEQYRTMDTDATDSTSMVVECATIPAASSLSTIHSITNQDQNPRRVYSKLIKTRSDLHKKKIKKQFSKRSLRIMRGLGLASPISDSLGNKSVPMPQHFQEPRHSTGQELLAGSSIGQKAVTFCGVPNVYNESESEVSVPTLTGYSVHLTSRQGDSSNAHSETDGCTTDTEGKREKWV